MNSEKDIDLKALYSTAGQNKLKRVEGSISQNVYLFCASEGLATVVRGSLDREALSKALKLPPQKKIMSAQTVGYPDNEGQ